MKPNVPRLICMVMPCFLMAACATPAAYREPIARFQQASTIVIEGSRVEYGLANKRERDAAIDKLVSSNTRISLRALNNKELRLLDADDLAARMAALNALAKHGQLLLTLASSDAPTQAKDAANSLDDAIGKLSSSLGAIPPGAFKSTASGFTSIAAEAVQLALNQKIAQALDKAIVASEAHVQTLTRLIQKDMAVLHERQRTILSAARVAAVERYNLEILNNPPAPHRLSAAAAEIKRMEDAWDNLPLSLSSDASLDAMAQAHQKLVSYARSSKTPQDLAELVEAIDAFVIQTAVIADAVKTIRQAKEE